MCPQQQQKNQRGKQAASRAERRENIRQTVSNTRLPRTGAIRACKFLTRHSSLSVEVSSPLLFDSPDFDRLAQVYTWGSSEALSKSPKRQTHGSRPLSEFNTRLPKRRQIRGCRPRCRRAWRTLRRFKVRFGNSHLGQFVSDSESGFPKLETEFRHNAGGGRKAGDEERGDLLVLEPCDRQDTKRIQHRYRPLRVRTQQKTHPKTTCLAPSLFLTASKREREREREAALECVCVRVNVCVCTALCGDRRRRRARTCRVLACVFFSFFPRILRLLQERATRSGARVPTGVFW